MFDAQVATKMSGGDGGHGRWVGHGGGGDEGVTCCRRQWRLCECRSAGRQAKIRLTFM